MPFCKQMKVLLLDSFCIKMIKVVANGILGTNEHFLKTPKVMIWFQLSAPERMYSLLVHTVRFQSLRRYKTGSCTASLRRKKRNELVRLLEFYSFSWLSMVYQVWAKVRLAENFSGYFCCNNKRKKQRIHLWILQSDSFAKCR